MINVGLAFLASALLFAAMGLAGYLAGRRSASKSRSAALTVFGHGALSSSGLIAFLAFFHVHQVWPLSLELHDLPVALAEVLRCDLEVSCAALTILALTGIVLVVSFVISQASSRVLLRRYADLEDRARSSALSAKGIVPSRARLLVVRDRDPDAFSFAILRSHPRRLLRAEDIVVVTTGLLDLLSEDEAEAVLAHEGAHVSAHDDRYLPFFHTLATLLFFDPVLRLLRRRVGRHHEFAADGESARSTGRPLSLARALLKVYLYGTPGARPTGLLGGARRSEILDRIEALLALADAGDMRVTVCRNP